MQCHEMRMLPDNPFLNTKSESSSPPIKTEKETIHSGHFMVSDFEAEAQDDEDEVAVPVSEMKYPDSSAAVTSELQVFNASKASRAMPQVLGIETSLSKIFQTCMTLCYRQELTSPKWNTFKGIRLKWKDKIRLNNVIWRCWHMQFIKKENTLICQFASPLDEGTHNKPEAIVLEGKYWKRKLAAVKAEYKKWRLFYRNKMMGWACKDSSVTDTDRIEDERNNQSTHNSELDHMNDEYFMELMNDTLFSNNIWTQPFAFPDTREIARSAMLADFIQPSLVQLQPNLEEFMDTFETDIVSSKPPSVPEECPVSDIAYRAGSTTFNVGQTSLTQPQTESINYRDISVPFPPIISCSNEPVPPAPVLAQPSDIKATRFYNEKVRDQPMIYPSQSQSFCINSDTSSAATRKSGVEMPPVLNELINFEARDATVPDASSSPSSALLSRQTPSRQEAFGFSGCVASKLQTGYGFDDFGIIMPRFSQYNLIQQQQQQHHDIASSSEFPSLVDVTLSAEQRSQLLKCRNKPRSNSSQDVIKGKVSTAASLSTTSSDSSTDIQSALLAQLLTSSAGVYGIQPASDRFYTTHSVTKSADVPILPITMKTGQQNKILPKPNQSGLLASSPVITSHSFVSTLKPTSSPESSKESPCVPSPGNLSQSPTSLVMFPGPLSPSKLNKHEGAVKPASAEQRRVCHINAEQKRRYNIKNGFDALHSLIPQLHQNPNVKLSKAAMLQKGAEYIMQLQAERSQALEDMKGLKYQIESLGASISKCQSLLPATGAPVSRHCTTKMREMFDDLVRAKTMEEDWKFYYFSTILFEPLLQSFNHSVSTASYDDLCRSTLIWLEQHCSLVNLRHAVFNSLRKLSTSTDILSDPWKLPEEARAAVSKRGI